MAHLIACVLLEEFLSCDFSKLLCTVHLTVHPAVLHVHIVLPTASTQPLFHLPLSAVLATDFSHK